jgi:heme-degrading monooxygenase HmoA
VYPDGRREEATMMMIVTHVTLKQGSEPEWDETMRERLSAVSEQPGWIGGQLLVPLDAPDQRVIVGTWEAREDWEAWHDDESFKQTRAKLDGLERAPSRHEWHEVIEDWRSGLPLDEAA